MKSDLQLHLCWRTVTVHVGRWQSHHNDTIWQENESLVELLTTHLKHDQTRLLHKHVWSYFIRESSEILWFRCQITIVEHLSYSFKFESKSTFCRSRFRAAQASVELWEGSQLVGGCSVVSTPGCGPRAARRVQAGRQRGEMAASPDKVYHEREREAPALLFRIIGTCTDARSRLPGEAAALQWRPVTQEGED